MVVVPLPLLEEPELDLTVLLSLLPLVVVVVVVPLLLPEEPELDLTVLLSLLPPVELEFDLTVVEL